MDELSYPVEIRWIESVGRFHVFVHDIPQIVASGADETEALHETRQALAAAITYIMDECLDLPKPSQAGPNDVVVNLPPRLAAKALVYRAWKNARLSKVELGKRMGKNETEVRRILDPRYGSKIDQIDEAAHALGIELVVSARPRSPTAA